MQEKTGFWSSLLTPPDLSDCQWNSLVIIWQGYISIKEVYSVKVPDCFYQLPLADFGGIGQISHADQPLNQSYISAKRIEEVFEAPEDIHSELEQKQATGDRVLQVQELTFTYPDAAQASLRDISLMTQGQLLGIIGELVQVNRLVQVLLGLYPADKGALPFIEMVVLFNLSSGGLGLPMSPKRSNFKGTIRSNLTLGFNQELTDQELWQALEIAQAKDFVSDKEGLLDAVVEAGGRNFSGGQKQRLSIARAVLRQAPFLILDDATSALDTITESKLLKAIREKYAKYELNLDFSTDLDTSDG